MSRLIEITGKALSGEWGTDDEIGTGIPVLRTTNFTNEGIVDYTSVVTRTITKKNIEEKYLRNGDIIIEKSGGSDNQPVGRVIFFEGPANTYLFNNFTGVLRVRDSMRWLPKFVFYSLFANYEKGGTRPFENKTTGLHNLKTDDYVSKFEVLDLDIATQQQICDSLDRVRAVICLRRQQISQLDELVKARFVEMFGNPVTDSMSWGQRPLKDMLVSIRYGTSTPPQFTDEGYAFIRATNIKNGHIVNEDMKRIPQFEADRLEKCKLSGGEIIIVRSGVNAGDTCVVINEYVGQYAGYDMILVLNELLNPVFFNTLVNTDYMDRVVKPMTRRAAQPHLNSEQTQSFPIICVPRGLQDQFAKFVEQVDKSKFVIQKALDEAQLLFDSLMQKYFE